MLLNLVVNFDEALLEMNKLVVGENGCLDEHFLRFLAQDTDVLGLVRKFFIHRPVFENFHFKRNLAHSPNCFVAPFSVGIRKLRDVIFELNGAVVRPVSAVSLHNVISKRVLVYKQGSKSMGRIV